MVAYHRPGTGPPPATLGLPTDLPRMIGGRIFNGTMLVGFALGRSVYLLAPGKLACPGAPRLQHLAHLANILICR